MGAVPMSMLVAYSGSAQAAPAPQPGITIADQPGAAEGQQPGVTPLPPGAHAPGNSALPGLLTGSAQPARAQFITPQPGVTTPSQPGDARDRPAPTPVQPGVTSPPTPEPTPVQPGVTAPVPPPQYVTPEQDLAGEAPETDFAQYRQEPNPPQVAPLKVGELHPPEPTPPVAVIVPPSDTLRAGDLNVVAPDFLSPQQVHDINSVFAGPEAQISQFARSVGVAPTRADSVAAGAVGGAVTGALIGCGAGVAVGAATLFMAPLMVPVGCVLMGTGFSAVGGLIGAGQGGLR
ncbi:hypothetical protein [Nocardia puris]|nr:hypothetical protein [Nocardia puris]